MIQAATRQKRYDTPDCLYSGGTRNFHLLLVNTFGLLKHEVQASTNCAPLIKDIDNVLIKQRQQQHADERRTVQHHFEVLRTRLIHQHFRAKHEMESIRRDPSNIGEKPPADRPGALTGWCRTARRRNQLDGDRLRLKSSTTRFVQDDIAVRAGEFQTIDDLLAQVTIIRLELQRTVTNSTIVFKKL